MRRRLLAMVALGVGTATLVLALVVAVAEFPRGLAVAGCVLVAAVTGWYGLLRRRHLRVAGLAVACLALAGAVALVFLDGAPLLELLTLAGVLVCVAAARATVAVPAQLPGVPAPRAPVLFYNPKSGGGKAERFALADEARSRGIEPVALKDGDDLETLVRDAVARGADGLAMAGGDGSQAVVAALAAEYELPYACIPSGTRNHFALDLGVDRDDVVGALDAFVDGGERCVDLAEVNGRVFVNNVSLGLYAEAVQRAGYREAKLRTLLDTVPDVLGPAGGTVGMRWLEGDGREHRTGVAVLVSNNRYRLGRAVGSGTRPRLDQGVLGITVIGAPSADGEPARSPQLRWREWTAPSFEVQSDRPLPAGIDGEALVLQAPLRFRARPGALRVRIARKHPGTSPSATAPEGVGAGVVQLWRIARGRDGAPAGATGGSAGWG
jgi:diacylglycerol kinase family enzyme